MKTLIGLILVFLFNTAAAQVYTWTDENGKKHYSDSPPPEYQERAKPVQMQKLNTMPKQESTITFESDNPSETRNSEEVEAERAAQQETLKQEKLEAAARELGEDPACLEAIAAYESSVSCFNQCRNKNGGINRAKCPECVNVTRPSCYGRVKQQFE